MKISIICPLFKAEKYIDKLHESILMQEDIELIEVKYLLTDTGDGLENKIKVLDYASCDVVKVEEFSHSLTRENAAMNAKGEIIVFISQDIIIQDRKWLYKFVKPIVEGKCEAAYSRQVCDNESIEKYIRMKNYGEKSIIVSKKDISELGIMTFFFSDAASAIRSDIYKELNGYDKKDLLTNEDMYLAYKLINAGYRKIYNADAVVIHSHDYKYRELFKRYFDQGVFLKDNNYLLEFKVNDSAFNLVMFVAVQAIKDKNFKVLFNIIPNFAVRFIGNKFGQNYNKLSINKVKKFSSNKNYWNRYLKKLEEFER